MPGFLGGSSGSSGTGGEITFPKEFIDPVTKLRVSQPENLIDTDFEYGLQPTKWETVELINNTPSFFSKSGDTTIPGIVSISTNNGTREITVVTATDHGLAVGIPINVTGTKSVTADGSYVINSIPNLTTFTYLCKDEQIGNNSIEDLYTSIITGEFFQGSQIRIADAEGITTDAEAISTLTVKTDSVHGFGLNTPFYFLNLNSTISQEFEASNTAAKSFDSSNLATAQTFDGSNTLSTFNIDWSNSATVGGTTSTINSVSTINNTITVAHGTETFASQPLGTPLYYNLTTPASSGYFNTNPRGVVFLKTTTALNSPVGFSTFQVSEIPNGTTIPIVSSMLGTFQLANQARTFAGNNLNPITQTNISIIKETDFPFDGGNQGFAGTTTNGLCTVEGYTGTTSPFLVSTTAGAGLDYYVGAMVRYTATGGSAPTVLTSGNTYFISSFAATATPNQYRIAIKELPDSATALAPTGGSATSQTFQKIGVSIDKNIVHVRDSSFAVKDMVEYSFPAGLGGRFTAATEDQTKLFYFITKAYDTHNYELSEAPSSFISATGGITSEVVDKGRTYRVHTFTTVGNTNFVVSAVGNEPLVEYLVVGGGGGGGSDAEVGGAGGAGGFRQGTLSVTAQTYVITVGAGGSKGSGPDSQAGGGTIGTNGGNSVFSTITSLGGGAGATRGGTANVGGSGGGGGDFGGVSAAGTAGQGFAAGPGGRANDPTSSLDVGAGGGAGGVGGSPQVFRPGPGLRSHITGAYPGAYLARGGAVQGDNGNVAGPANTGTGGSSNRDGGSGIVVIRYPITAAATFAPANASGGSTSTLTSEGVTYRVHQFTTVGTTNFVVSSVGSWNEFDYLIVAGGGGGGGGWAGGGGGGGGVLAGRFTASATTYPVVVGGGGDFGTWNSGRIAQNGGNSSVFGLTALGGGRGGGHAPDYAANVGGSGGGNAPYSGAPAAGTPGQGFAGGAGEGSGGPMGGGGGGAGEAGLNASVPQAPRGGRGGDGYATNIRTGAGTIEFFGGGGGGGGHGPASPPAQGGYGGRGGGARGANYGTENPPAATPNTGGGGGGAGGRTGIDGYSSSAGGSGIVIIRYPIAVV
jgi:hypothetical protein